MAVICVQGLRLTVHADDLLQVVMCERWILPKLDWSGRSLRDRLCGAESQRKLEIQPAIEPRPLPDIIDTSEGGRHLRKGMGYAAMCKSTMVRRPCARCTDPCSSWCGADDGYHGPWPCECPCHGNRPRCKYGRGGQRKRKLRARASRPVRIAWMFRGDLPF